MDKHSYIKLFLLLLIFGASNFALSGDLDSKTFSSLKAKANIKDAQVIYVDFWASWCQPCRQSFPWMNAMQEKYRDKGLSIVAINVDKDRAVADTFLEEVGSELNILFDPKAEYAKAFHVLGMPSSFILDSQGEIHFAHKGFFETKTAYYEQELASMLQRRGNE